jgi:hypothetical protein
MVRRSALKDHGGAAVFAGRYGEPFTGLHGTFIVLALDEI